MPAISNHPDAELIGPYRLLEQIGHGGQGDVHRAEDMRTGQHVALKVLTQRAATSLPAIERFRREAEVTSKLSHPGICPIYEVGVDGEVPYIAMKLIEGQTLAKRISTARDRDTSTYVSLPQAGDGVGNAAATETALAPSHVEVIRIVRMFEQAAHAVHAAHEAGVLHRDLKPGNMMVTTDGQPVILDFGLAEELDSDNPTLTISGDLLGTLHYMSPEQIAAKRIRLDRRTDVWSLGAALYEALTLRKPFESPTRDGLLQAILAKEPVDPRQINRAIPADLRTVMETTLDKDRDRRYATALDLAEDLRRVRVSEHVLAKPASWAIRLRRWSRRNPALATGLAGVFAALIVSIVLLIQVASERDAKNSALAAKTAALNDYDRLGDSSRLQKLVSEADKLWPCVPALVPAMKSWIDRASVLEERLVGHQAVLARLRLQGEAAGPESRAAQSQPSDSRPNQVWQFDDPAEQFKHDTTAKLVADLTAFVDPDPKRGLLADVCCRLVFAETVQRETIGKYETKWADAIRSIADIAECPKYNGLKIKPQLGLIPIGKDPKSGLWEFVQLQTVAPGTEPVPQRRVDGRLEMTQSTGIVFVLIPAGSFLMGAEPPKTSTTTADPNVDPDALPNESPVHAVTLDAFFMSKYEMTQAQWQRAVGVNPSLYQPGVYAGSRVDLRNPVEQVRWTDCHDCMRRLGLALPTEAEWEYAARAGTTTPRWMQFGPTVFAKSANVADAYCRKDGHPSWNYESWDDGYHVHAPAGHYDPNPFGLHDVLGNVREWCQDHLEYYDVAAASGDWFRAGASDKRVYRGGSWNFDSKFARSAARSAHPPHMIEGNLGLRPARPVSNR